jgi:putative ABC transport system permease protein
MIIVPSIPDFGTKGLFLRLGWQHLGRRPARTALLVTAVAVSAAAVFAALIVRTAVEDSLTRGLARLGADLLVVPRDTLVNLTAALLTAEPTTHTLAVGLADEVARLPGVEQVAPQWTTRAPLLTGAHAHDADLVAFDPARDFTVMPWLQEAAERPFGPADVIVGGRREEAVGTEVLIGGRPRTVYGRLGLTGVGPFDRSLFVGVEAATAAPPSGLLVRLRGGVTPEQVRFALARIPGVKVVAGASVFASVRHVLAAVLSGLTVFTALMLLASAVMVGVLFSAILTERRRELGVLLAVGTRRRQLVGMILAEAALATGLGGVCGLAVGAAVLLGFRRSIGYYFETINVPLIWPSTWTIGAYAMSTVALSIAVGLVGVAIPAWRASGLEPYELVRGEGG